VGGKERRKRVDEGAGERGRTTALIQAERGIVTRVTEQEEASVIRGVG